jgi:hypothetical protein
MVKKADHKKSKHKFAARALAMYLHCVEEGDWRWFGKVIFSPII